MPEIQLERLDEQWNVSPSSRRSTNRPPADKYDLFVTFDGFISHTLTQ
jgi:hypothetical protein